MTNLTRLSVSLTKEGAYKVAELLERVEPDEVLKNAKGRFKGINIDIAQTRKVLSASSSGKLPDIWHPAKRSGRSSINGLVILAIIFSHHTIIDAMRNGIEKFGRGTLKRKHFNPPKVFSNLKGDFRELNFSTSLAASGFSFDIRPILRDRDMGRLALSLLGLKLIEAGWSGTNDVGDECVRVGFHQCLGMTEAQFREWTAAARKNVDELPDSRDPDESTTDPFRFKAGHLKRKSGEVVKRGHGEDAKARLIHNDLVDKLYQKLVSIHGKANVGTELTGGPSQTSIDLVVRSKGAFIFYEVKTSPSLRKCIREAIPQLLEYAYWPKEERAKELIIVTTNSPTKDGRAYLKHLRDKFDVPIFHETIDRKTGTLSKRM